MSERPKAKMPVEEIRRANLRQLVRDYQGTQQEFCKQLPFGPARLSHLIGPASTERFSEDVAAQIERALNLVPGSISRAEKPTTRRKPLEDEQAAAIAYAIMQASASIDALPTLEIVEEVTRIAADNARLAGTVDLGMVASLTRALLSRETGKSRK